MNYIELQGVRVPALGFGTWSVNGADCVTAVSRALEIGYRHIDTAANYGNEAEVGQAIRDSGVPREEIFLTTKVAQENLAHDDLLRSLEGSLRRLGVEYVDLLLIHWPNMEIPLGDSLSALEKAKAAGQARAIGVSNFPVALLEESVEQQGAALLCNQVEYHPFLSQNRVLEYLRAHAMMLTAYCPLARGAVSEESTLQEIAQTHGKTPAQVTLRWLLDQQNVAAIPRSVSKRHVQENFDIFDFDLSAEESVRIDGLTGNHRLLNFATSPSWDVA